MLLTLSMIVRDEEEQLPGCLASVRDAVDEIVVVDTGSGDRSAAIAQEFGARVLHAAWQGDFSAARNIGVNAARGRWILVMDADERFEGNPGHLRRLLKGTSAIGFEVPIRNEVGDGRVDLHSTLRLFRRLPGVRFERRLHEQVLPSLLAVGQGARIDTAPFALRHLGYTPGIIERKRKRERNLELAKAEVSERAVDPFAAFNLGVEYTATGDLAGGVAEFRRARAITGGPQPWQSRLYKVEAQNLYKLAQYEEALEVLEEGLTAFPNYTDLHFLRGVSLEAGGDVVGAETAFRRCLRLGPAKTPPHDGVDPLLGGPAAATALGSLLRRLGRSSEALPLLRSAVFGAPGWMPAVQELVECQLASGAEVSELLSQAPPDPLEIGAALFRSRRYALAVQAFSAGEATRPDLPPDHFLAKALALVRLGDLDGAKVAVEPAGAGAIASARAYVVDLVEFARGALPRESLEERYAEGHPIWRDIPPQGAVEQGN